MNLTGNEKLLIAFLGLVAISWLISYVFTVRKDATGDSKQHSLNQTNRASALIGQSFLIAIGGIIGVINSAIKGAWSVVFIIVSLIGVTGLIASIMYAKHQKEKG